MVLGLRPISLEASDETAPIRSPVQIRQGSYGSPELNVGSAIMVAATGIPTEKMLHRSSLRKNPSVSL
jgi:hypothetical protein